MSCNVERPFSPPFSLSLTRIIFPALFQCFNPSLHLTKNCSWKKKRQRKKRRRNGWSTSFQPSMQSPFRRNITNYPGLFVRRMMKIIIPCRILFYGFNSAPLAWFCQLLFTVRNHQDCLVSKWRLFYCDPKSPLNNKLDFFQLCSIFTYVCLKLWRADFY